MVVPLIEATSPSKLRVLNPRKLLPPQAVVAKQKERAFKEKMKNPVVRFFVVFFGEGF